MFIKKYYNEVKKVLNRNVRTWVIVMVVIVLICLVYNLMMFQYENNDDYIIDTKPLIKNNNELKVKKENTLEYKMELESIVNELKTYTSKDEQLTSEDSIRIEYLLNKYDELKK